GMVTALEGTGSTLSLYTFGTSAPQNSSHSGHRQPLPVDGNAQLLRDRIAGYTPGGTSSNIQYTNWDRGLQQVVESGYQYDLVVVITDGNPTRSLSSAQGSGSQTRFRELEPAIFAANAIKATGARVIAVGVGDGVSGNPANLRAVSG